MGTVVLVVDDDAGVRSLASRILGRSGYTVLEADDGESALVAVESSEEEVTLLLADVVLPGMDGAELAGAVRERHPDVEVIFMSGFAEKELERRGIRDVGAAYITKPFTADILTLMVTGALHE